MTDDVSVSELSRRHAQWLLARHKAVANNIAHASTPGYRAVDVRPFAEVLSRKELGMRATNSGHLRLADDESPRVRTTIAKAGDVSHSGNSVSLDQQMMNANEVRQGYALNTAIVKSFHRLVISAVKA